MKTMTLFVLALSIAFPLAAGNAAPDAVRGADAAEMLIPVAGRVVGAGGELFRTDLTLVSYSASEQQIELIWLPRGGTESPLRRNVTLGAFRFLTFENVVESVFETQGLGAIRIVARDTSGSPAAGAVDAHARIWTETTCGGEFAGTMSQSVPALLMEGWRDGSGAYVHGVRHGGEFRTNYGIVNMDAQSRRFRVLVNSLAGRGEEIVTVPPFGMVHRHVPAVVLGDLSVYVEPLDPPGSAPRAGSWRAYASTTDNLSGSGWTVIAIQPRTDPLFGGIS